MTDTTTIALKLAEEALLLWEDAFPLAWDEQDKQALAAIREALTEQEKQEPVAWMVTSEGLDGTPNTYPLTGRYKDVCDMCDFGDPVPLYAAPVSAKREWVDLTDYEIEELPFNRVSNEPLNEYARAVIAAFKGNNK